MNYTKNATVNSVAVQQNQYRFYVFAFYLQLSYNRPASY